jgi:hypothetical protein
MINILLYIGQEKLTKSLRFSILMRGYGMTLILLLTRGILKVENKG